MHRIFFYWRAVLTHRQGQSCPRYTIRPSERHSDPLQTKTTRPISLNIHSYPPNDHTSSPISYVHRHTTQSTHPHLTLQYLFEKYHPNLLRAAYDSVKIINLIPNTAYFPLNHQPMNELPGCGSHLGYIMYARG